MATDEAPTEVVEAEEPAASAPPDEAPVDAPNPKQTELMALSASSGSSGASVGQYYVFEQNGKKLTLLLKGVQQAPPDTTQNDLMLATSGGGGGGTGGDGGETIQRSMTQEQISYQAKMEAVEELVPDSTNAWLYVVDSLQVSEDDEAPAGCTEDMTNKFIAGLVIVLQITSYIFMTWTLVAARNQDYDDQVESTYGPYKKEVGDVSSGSLYVCMAFSTGGLTSVLLVGFLWSDVVATMALMRKGGRWLFASIPILIELTVAIVCGFFVGVYSESDFDAIGGAVGILFVHDLDEKVYASMKAFENTERPTLKKMLAVALWLIVSFTVALLVACRYEGGALIGNCKQNEFSCQSGTPKCIWEGLVCNGVEDCSDGSDELTGGDNTGNLIISGDSLDEREWTCNYALDIECDGPDYYEWDASDDNDPDCDDCKDDVPKQFMCEETGTCIEFSKVCNGVIDCADGSDENRDRGCEEQIKRITCGSGMTIEVNEDRPSVTDYYKTWTGEFKCNSGQCIDAEYACDGIPGDCADGTDEYPGFNKARATPWLVACPYPSLVECDDDEVMCKISGRCIPKSAVCDGVSDCVDGADEQVCSYECESDQIAGSKFQCAGGIAGVNGTDIIKWIDDYNADDYTGDDREELLAALVEANTVTQEEFIADDALRAELFDRSDDKCIPIEWRCDGVPDCDDGTDEQLCALLGCAAGEFECTSENKCVGRSAMCDGQNDCIGGEDEVEATCAKLGISLGGNACIDAGYFYQCKGCETCCIYEWDLCTGVQDCPQGEDEIDEDCQAAFEAYSNTASFSSSSGDFECGSSVTGTAAFAYETIQWTFTAGSESETLIRMCDDSEDSKVGGYLLIYGTSSGSSGGSSSSSSYYGGYGGYNYFGYGGGGYYASGYYDYDCDCSNREYLQLSDLTAGDEYTVSFTATAAGKFQVDIECAGSTSVGSQTCTESENAYQTTPWYCWLSSYAGAEECQGGGSSYLPYGFSSYGSGGYGNTGSGSSSYGNTGGNYGNTGGSYPYSTYY